jgi:AcrR family transcriptional regulator
MSKGETTKQKIVAAAKNLFGTCGYSQATIDDIITAAGITKGAFYHYFKSKETICTEIIDDIKKDYQAIFESLPKNVNPLQKLKTAVGQILELNRSGQWVNCKLILHISIQAHLLPTSVKQKLDSFWKWYIDQYRQLITQCRDFKLIGSKLSVQQQVDLIIILLIGNVWTKTVFDRSQDGKIVDYIIEKL